MVVSRGKGLDLLRPDDLGRLVRVAHAEVFGCVRSLATLRLPGTAQDFLVVGSDSGRLAVLRFDKERSRFEAVHRETFGRSGCRRAVPGQFLAADPKGRAVMVAAVEKQKLVYVMNRDQDAALTISSPLEAHKAHTLCLCLTALDCGFENPTFAAVELDTAEAYVDASGAAAAAAQRLLTYYELDLGLNHVVRRWSEPTDAGANLLIAVPGGGDGPGGVLVCCENFILYRHEGHAEVRAALPRRPDLPAERGVLLVASATHRQKNMFFFLVQSEYGDLYKVTLEHEGDKVSDVVVRYFDTLPAACTSVCVLKTGFLFAASEFGDHALYQFESLGDDAEEEGLGGETRASALAAARGAGGGGFKPSFFCPRPLKNLSLVDRAESLSPITQMRVANPFSEESPVVFAACGCSGRPALKALRMGLAAQEVAATQLQGTPLGVWTMKATSADEHHASIVVSFVNATMVLSIGATVEEVTDSGLLDKTPTLQVQLLTDDSILQVHPDGLRHVRPDGRVNEWRCPGRKQVVTVSSNPRQVALSLTGGELVYFEMDGSGQVVEMERKELTSDVACLHITPVPEGRLRSKFLAVGGHDATVRVLSLDPEGLLSPLAVQAVAAAPHSLLAMDGGAGGLFLHAGLSNGVLLRTEVDRVGGQLSDTRTRFLGTKPPKLRPCVVGGRDAMLCLSSRPWLAYTEAGGRFAVTPLAYEALADAVGLSSEQCPEGVVAVTKDELRVVLVEGLGEAFNATTCPLSYTPRDFVVDEPRRLVAVIEAEHGARVAGRGGDGTVTSAAYGRGNGTVTMEVDGEQAAEGNGNENGGGEGGLEGAGAGSGALLRTRAAASGTWASCVRLVDPAGMETVQVLDMEENEAAVSMCLVQLEGSEERMLAVGTARNMRLAPRSADGGSVRVYRFAGEGGRSLELLHVTALDGIPGAMAEFHGRLLVGVGGSLRLYSPGKKRMLKKCENRKFPNFVTNIQVLGERIYVSDASESLFFVRYRSGENQLAIYADDIVPRYMSAACLLDYDTMAGADKFGNVFVSRLPQGLAQDPDDDAAAGGRSSDAGRLRGAPHKLVDVANFHIGDTVTAMDRCALQPGGREFLLYGTVMGEVGALFPLNTSAEADFFAHLEMHMRQESPPLCGRDHLSFRSAYFPVKRVVDGDLCEEFQALAPERQRRVAEELDRSPGEVLKKLEDLRAKMI